MQNLILTFIARDNGVDCDASAPARPQVNWSFQGQYFPPAFKWCSHSLDHSFSTLVHWPLKKNPLKKNPLVIPSAMPSKFTTLFGGGRARNCRTFWAFCSFCLPPVERSMLLCGDFFLHRWFHLQAVGLIVMPQHCSGILSLYVMRSVDQLIRNGDNQHRCWSKVSHCQWHHSHELWSWHGVTQ